MKDEKGATVGQINVVENQYAYQLPLRVMYLVKDGPTKAAQVAKLTARFAAHKPALQAYLNKKSFNQAFIECAFETAAAPRVHAFNAAQWAKDGHYDPLTNKLKDSTQVEDLLPYVAGQAKQGSSFHGITIYLTDLEFEGGNYGFGRLFPTNTSDIILFPEGVGGTRTFAHEIGHVLGLQHSFLNPGSLAQLEDAKSSAADKKLLTMQEEYLKTLKKNLASKKPGSAEARQEQQYIGYTEKAIRDIRQRLNNRQAQLESYAKNKYLFTQSATENIMDYYNQDLSFWHWQWKIMQQEVVKFYGAKTLRK